jgi:four helix bundle protein
MEAQNAESKADFIHKLKLAAKEAEEAQYWLMILESDPEFEGVDDLAGRLDEVQRLLASIISSSKRATAGKVG